MSKHTCNKERELAEIASDIKWIRKSLEGNGQKGLLAKVDNHARLIYTASGGVIVLYALVTLLISNVL